MAKRHEPRTEILEGGSFVDNVVAVLTSAVSSPLTTSMIVNSPARFAQGDRVAAAEATRPEGGRPPQQQQLQRHPSAPAPSAPHGTGALETMAVPAQSLAPAYKLILVAVIAITLLSGAADIVLAGIWEHPTPNQQSAFEAMGFAWKSGLGALFGLVGGKAA